MKKYDKYKDSGIEWIGEIPEHWKVKRIKEVANIETGNTPPKSEESNYEGDFLWVKPDELKELDIIIETKEKLTKEGRDLSRVVPKGSILVCGIGTIGKMGVAGKDLSTNQQINSIIPDNINLKEQFARFLFLSKLQEEEERVSNKVVVSILNKTKHLQIKIPLPAPAEQIIMFDYLDEATKKLNKVIENKKRQVELLKENSYVVLNKIIKKGLKHHLEMTKLGLDWLKEIPKEWKLKKLKSICYMKGRIGWQGLSQSEFTTEGPYLITGVNFKDEVIRWGEVYHITEERYNEAPEIQLKINDILITKDGTIGKLLFVDQLPGKASLNSHLLVLRPLDNDFLPKYLFYLLQSDIFQAHIELFKTGTTFYGITQESIGRFKMILPSIVEQEKIVSYLEEHTIKNKRSLTLIEEEISQIKEYKKIIINDVVTGKMKVTA